MAVAESGRHAGRSRARGWAALWALAAAFGTVPLTLRALDVAVAFWGVTSLALVYAWTALAVLKRGRRRKAPRVNAIAPCRIRGWHGAITTVSRRSRRESIPNGERRKAVIPRQLPDAGGSVVY